jgi:hypothetical protein
MFSDKSRYKDLTTYESVDSRGRTVKVVAVPNKPNKAVLGIHALKQGQRIDHLASRYINDEAGFWRIAEANDVMLAEALTEQQEIAIPTKN